MMYLALSTYDLSLVVLDSLELKADSLEVQFVPPFKKGQLFQVG